MARTIPMFVRALVAASVCVGSAACEQGGAGTPPKDSRPEIHVAVTAQGYEPARAQAPANAPIRLVFTRTTDEGCGQQLAVPSLNLRRDLPLNEPVELDVTMPPSGSLAFTCGMDMYRGAVVVQ